MQPSWRKECSQSWLLQDSGSEPPNWLTQEDSGPGAPGRTWGSLGVLPPCSRLVTYPRLSGNSMTGDDWESGLR